MLTSARVRIWTAQIIAVAVCIAVVSSGSPAVAESVPAALPVCFSAPFTDVAPNQAFCAEIKWAVATGITTGYPDGTFRPTGLVSRQATAAFLWRLKGSPAPASGAALFADVDATNPFFSAIQWMGQSGLSTGSPDPAGGLPLFKPQDLTSRVAMGAFLWRLEGSPPPAAGAALFADVDSSSGFFSAIQWMGQSGMSTGSANPAGGQPLYLPSALITRQAAVAFLARFALRPPGAPTGVAVVSRDKSAAAWWSAPTKDGGSPITSYVVTASPGGQTCTWVSGPLTCTVTGLTNGTTYELTVRAQNAQGAGTQSAAGRARPVIAALRTFYVRPSDVAAVADRPAQIVSATVEARRWFGTQLGGLAPQVESSGGMPTVTSLVLPWTQAQLLALPDAHYSVTDYLKTNYGLSGQDTVIWLEGTVSGNYCGITGWGSVFIPMGACSIYPSSPATFPYDSTYLLVHELTHMLGAVPACAPHSDGGHVNDDNRDVLYTGPLGRDWDHLELDPGHDDYLTASHGACRSILDSPHLQ